MLIIRKIFTIFTLFSLLILFSSCTNNLINPDGTDARGNLIDNNKGLLFASLTTESKKNLFSKNYDSGSYFHVIHEKDFDEYDKPKFFSSIDTHTLSSHDYVLNGFKADIQNFSNKGRLNVIALEPGNYALVNWSLRSRNVTFTPKKFYHQKFTIEQNKVTYIGNLHIETLYGSLLSITFPSGVNPNCSDNSEKDITLFQKDYVKFSSWPISKQIVSCELTDTDGWELKH